MMVLVFTSCFEFVSTPKQNWEYRGGEREANSLGCFGWNFIGWYFYKTHADLVETMEQSQKFGQTLILEKGYLYGT